MAQSQPSAAREQVRDIVPGLIDLSERVLFGEVWERPGLSKRDRSLITCATLIALGLLHGRHPDPIIRLVVVLSVVFYGAIAFAALYLLEGEIASAVLIAVHSFTPVFKQAARPWHVSLLYNRDPRLAHILLDLLRGQHGLVVGDNEPYRVTDESDYTIPIHGEQRDLPHVLIEIRQDLIANEAGQRRWAGLFAQLLPQAYQRLITSSQPEH